MLTCRPEKVKLTKKKNIYIYMSKDGFCSLREEGALPHKKDSIEKRVKTPEKLHMTSSVFPLRT